MMKRRVKPKRRALAMEQITVEQRPPGVRRLVPFKAALRYGNWGKSRAYELIADGKIRAFKDGRRTLVDLNSVDEYQENLPPK